MLAIFKREFMSFFKSPVGYIAFALFAFLSGFIFVSKFISPSGYVNMSTEIISLRTYLVIIVPIITMGLFAEDKKRGTDIIYYTSPISLFSVVIGKFLAAFALFGVMFVNIIVHMIITKAYGGNIDLGVLGSTLVLFVIAALFIALGVLGSALTDNQIVAAILSFVMIMIVQLLPYIGSLVSTCVSAVLGVITSMSSTSIGKVTDAVNNAFVWLDPFSRTESFRYGVFPLLSIVYCLSFAAFFLFLTYRILEKKRWSQS